MQENTDTILHLDLVSRLYPRDISDTPSAILREMFLPQRARQDPTPELFFALRDINLRLRKGQKLGVIGTHRSGKSTLAGIASGVLEPTSGHVTAYGSRLLIGRPTAGFKPTLTTLENLRLRGTLAGLHGETLNAAIDKTLSRCGLSHSDAQKPMGNQSAHIVKQLGLTLLLEIPAEILVIDELTSAGIGDARWETRGFLQEKIESSTALVISSDFSFIQDIAEEAVLLHHGRLYGPFGVEKAIDLFNQLPEEDAISGQPDALYDPLQPPTISSHSLNSDSSAQPIDDDPDPYDHIENDIGDEVKQPEIRGRQQNTAPPWKALNIKVDGEDYRHSQFSLMRRPGTLITVTVEMIALRKHRFDGGLFVLHGGNSGLEVGNFFYDSPEIPIDINHKRTLSFDLMIPDLNEAFYGLTFCPRHKGKHFPQEHRIKILIFGIGQKHSRREILSLEINNNSFDRKIEDAHINTN